MIEGSLLPIGMDELLSGAVESARLEFKASWDEKRTGPQVIATLCAFANDLQNLNGGYVVIGLSERDGVAVRPAAGLDPADIDAAQKWIRGHCNTIVPVYMPVFCPETLDGRPVLVLWAPASDIRPHQAPSPTVSEKKFFVRIGSATVEAKDSILTNLMQQTARVPFDDRRAFEARIEDLREGKVREFLRDVRSSLVDVPDVIRVYRMMQLTRPVNGSEAPRNVSVLFFTEDPEGWLKGARIEVVQFADDAGGNTLEERVFRGAVHEQIRNCMSFLQTLSTSHLEKIVDHAETRGWVSYPIQAMREAVVNAVYHRSYEDSTEPTKIYLYPDRMEIISYPGPVHGIERDTLSGEEPLPPVPARNRRIGEFLKELRLAEGRGTGLPKIYRSMEENGSPRPAFDFDDARSYFRVKLPAHPEFLAMAALRDAAYLRATGDETGANRRLAEAFRSRPQSSLLAVELIRQYAAQSRLDDARAAFDSFQKTTAGAARVVAAMADAYLDAGEQEAARSVLDRMPDILSTQDAFQAAMLERRAGRQKQAHQLFLRAGDAVLQDSRAAHEFAQSKLDLATALLRRRHRSSADNHARQRLLREAETLLERVIQMDASPIRHGWAWFNLAQARRWLKKPTTEVVAAYECAARLLPNESVVLRRLTEARSENAHRRTR